MARESPELESDSAMNVVKEDESSKDESSKDEASEPEYEIEEIRDAKKGAFPFGRLGYLVKWKGYDETENSWVHEDDIGNAQDLVEEYWKKNSKHKKGTPKMQKRPRRSAAADDESESKSAAKKSGRRSKRTFESEEEDAQPAKPKKAKKTTTKDKAESQVVRDMAKYMDRESWEDLIDTVDTVERTEGGLVMYFTLKNGETVRESGEICRTRFPQKLLSFYESNLKWRFAEPSGDGSNEDD